MRVFRGYLLFPFVVVNVGERELLGIQPQHIR
jgi:hypothetical protein